MGNPGSEETEEKAYFIGIFFGLTRVNPGQPIWPVTRSLDRVDH